MESLIPAKTDGQSCNYSARRWLPTEQPKTSTEMLQGRWEADQTAPVAGSRVLELPQWLLNPLPGEFLRWRRSPSSSTTACTSPTAPSPIKTGNNSHSGCGLPWTAPLLADSVSPWQLSQSFLHLCAEHSHLFRWSPSLYLATGCVSNSAGL